MVKPRTENSFVSKLFTHSTMATRLDHFIGYTCALREYKIQSVIEYWHKFCHIAIVVPKEGLKTDHTVPMRKCIERNWFHLLLHGEHGVVGSAITFVLNSFRSSKGINNVGDAWHGKIITTLCVFWPYWHIELSSSKVRHLVLYQVCQGFSNFIQEHLIDQAITLRYLRFPGGL